MAAVTLSLSRYAPRDLAALVAASVVDVEVASVAEIAASEAVLTEAHEADSVVAIAGSAAPPTATGALQMHRVDLATAEVEAGMAGDLTVTAGTMEVVAAVAAVMAVATTTVFVAAVATAALIDLGLAATQNQLAPAKVVAVVGIATETTTGETTPESALTRVVQATKESGNFVGISHNKTRPTLALWWVS